MYNLLFQKMDNFTDNVVDGVKYLSDNITNNLHFAFNSQFIPNKVRDNIPEYPSDDFLPDDSLSDDSLSSNSSDNSDNNKYDTKYYNITEYDFRNESNIGKNVKENEKTTLYVLLLQDQKYYVGRTGNLKRIINEHFNGKGSEWTKVHTPVRIIEVLNNQEMYDEEKITFKYMEKFGINNVRGGSFTRVCLHRCDLYILRKIIRNKNFPPNNIR